MKHIHSFYAALLLLVVGLVLAPLVAADSAAESERTIAIIVHPDNPIETLPESQVRQIYLGSMVLYPGSRTVIDVFDQPSQSNLFRNFYQQLAHISPELLTRQRMHLLFSGRGKLPEVRNDDLAVVEAVAKSPHAIGYVMAASVTTDVKMVFHITLD